MPARPDPLVAALSGGKGRSGSALLAIGASALAVAPVLAIAHPVLVLPLTLVPIGLMLLVLVPIWLCLGFVVFSFFRLHEVFPVLNPLHIPQLLSLGTLFVLAWHGAVKRSISPYWTPSLTATAVFFSLATLGIPFASNPGMSFAYWTSSYVKVGIMTLAIAWLVRKPGDFALASRFIVLSGAAVSVVAVQNKLAGIGLVEGTRVTIGRDIGSVLGDPNDLSLVLTFPLSFAVSLATTRSGFFGRLLGLGAVPLIIWAVLSTQSRGGLLGVMAVFGVTGLRLIRSKVLLGAIGGIAALVLFTVAGISDRSSGGAAEAGIDESAMGRLYAWQAAFNMALARPLNGVGIDNFIPNFWLYTPHWTGFNKAVHSTWLGVLAETGFPGLIAFVTMIVVSARMALVASRLLRRHDAPAPVQAVAFAIVAGLAGFCASGTFLTQGFTWPAYILIALSAAVSHYAKPFAEREAIAPFAREIRLNSRENGQSRAGTEPART